MSRYNPHRPNIDRVYEAAARWRETCLIGDGSIFGTDNLWTAKHVEAVWTAYGPRGETGAEETFLGQLRLQLGDKPPQVFQLVAEMLWAIDLFAATTDIAPETKRTRIREVWSWSGTPLGPDVPYLQDEALEGVGRPGTAFHTLKWRELKFLVQFLRKLKALPTGGRSEILADPWSFVDWLDAATDDRRTLKQIIPFLLFPDSFERIASLKDKTSALTRLTGVEPRSLKDLKPSDLNRRLFDLRAQLETEAGGPIDFYDPAIKARWEDPQQKSVAQASAPIAAQPSAPSSDHPLNLILHGPPGTGKTYAVVDRAVGILDPGYYALHHDERAELKTRFDQLRRDGRIAFVTFHQSYSYEDFVEGIRPTTDATGAIRYEVQDGIFKSLCRPDSKFRLRAGEVIRNYEVLEQTPEILWLRKPNDADLPLPLRIIEELVRLCRTGELTIEDIAKRQVFDRVKGTRLEKYIVHGYDGILSSVVDRFLKAEQGAAAAPSRLMIIDEINRGNVSGVSDHETG